MSALALTSEDLDAKARTQFVLAMAQAGIDPRLISDELRRLWIAAYKMGYSTGARDASEYTRELIKDAAK